jgi:hypothetical protein
MIIDRHIKPHDFISGKPKTIWWTAIQSTNPCGEISLGFDPIDCQLGQGLEAGELGVVLAPPSTGRSLFTQTVQDIQRYFEESRVENGTPVVNMDYATLYSHMPISDHTRGLADDLSDSLRRLREERERYRNMNDTQRAWAKIMLNSNY